MSIVTVAEVKRHLRITHNSDDILLQELLDQAEDEIRQYLDRDELPRIGSDYPVECNTAINLDPASDVADLPASIRGGIYVLTQAMYEGKPEELETMRNAALAKVFPYRKRLGI